MCCNLENNCNRMCRTCNTPRSNQTHCWKPFVHCLVPPVVWFFLVLNDGEYLVCGGAIWNGDYAFDDELHMRWCKPTNKTPIGIERDLARNAMSLSQVNDNCYYYLKHTFLKI